MTMKQELAAWKKAKADALEAMAKGDKTSAELDRIIAENEQRGL